MLRYYCWGNVAMQEFLPLFLKAKYVGLNKHSSSTLKKTKQKQFQNQKGEISFLRGTNGLP